MDVDVDVDVDESRLIFKPHPDLPDLGVSTAAILVRGANNSVNHPDLTAHRRRAALALHEHWKSRPVMEHPAIKEYTDVLRSLGAEDSTPPPARLLLYARRHRDLPAQPGGPIGDCCAEVSARTMLIVNALDLDRIEPPVSASPFCGGGEAGITADTRNAIVLLWGNRMVAPSALLHGAWLLAEMVERFCGGGVEVAGVTIPPIAHETSRAGMVHRVGFDVFKGLDLVAGRVTGVDAHQRFPSLAVVRIDAGCPVEALSPMAPAANLIGRTALLARGLHPLRVGDGRYTCSLVAAGTTGEIVTTDAPIPAGCKVS